MMRSGKDPFGLRPENTGKRIMNWFFKVPSGWQVVIGSAPFAFESGSGNSRVGLFIVCRDWVLVWWVIMRLATFIEVKGVTLDLMIVALNV
jgi:hypothetical protein